MDSKLSGAEEFSKAGIIDRIHIQISDDKKNELISFINREKSIMQDSRREWEDRQRTFLDNYDDFVSYTRKGSWDGASNLKMPLTAIMVKSYATRLYNMFSHPNITNLVAREDTDSKTEFVFKKLREWYLYDYLNDRKGIKSILQEICFDTAAVGFSVVMKNYVLKQEKIFDFVPYNKEELVEEFEDLNSEVIKLESEERVDTRRFKEVEKVITSFEGTMLRTISWEDVLFPNNVPTSDDLNYPKIVIVSSALSKSELKLGSLQGIYNPEAVEKVLEFNGKNKNLLSTSIKLDKDLKTGISQNLDENDYSINYCFLRYDLDDDGVEENLVVILEPNSNEILSIKHLYQAYLTNKRPLFKFSCFRKPRQAYSRGVPEYMFSLQDEMDRNHNFLQDVQQLIACPWGIYRSNSSFEDKPIQIVPGKFLPVETTNDLRVMNLNSNIAPLLNNESQIWNYAQWMAGVSPIGSGIVPDQVGPLRSTSGVAAMVAQSEKDFRPVADGFALQWKFLEESILEDLDKKIPFDLKKRVLGPKIDYLFPNLDQINNDYFVKKSLEISKSFDLKIEVASVISSDEFRRNNAMQIMQIVNNPSLMQQFGIVKAKHVYNAYVDLLNSYGIYNVDQYAERPNDIEMLSLNDEIEYIRQGQIPPMSMQDNHEEKAAGLESFANTDVYFEMKALGRADPTSDEVMKKTILKHLELAKLLEPKGMPNFSGETGLDINATMVGQGKNQELGAYEQNRQREDQNITVNQNVVQDGGVQGPSTTGGEDS